MTVQPVTESIFGISEGVLRLLAVVLGPLGVRGEGVVDGDQKFSQGMRGSEVAFVGHLVVEVFGELAARPSLAFACGL